MAVGPRIDRWLTILIRGVTGSENWENVLAYRSDHNIGDDAQLYQIAAAFTENVLPIYASFMSNTSYIVSLLLRTNYVTGVNYEVVYPLTPPLQGGVSSDAAPQNAAPVISWRTGAVGRSFRGRSFIAGLADSAATNSVLTSGALSGLAQIAAAIATFVGPLPTNALRFVIASRKLLQLIDVLSAVIDLYSRSQRTRLPGEKKHKKKKPAA